MTALYRVTSGRYRSHDTGSTFIARLDPEVERRAIGRGSISRIREVKFRPRSYVFPDGWLPADSSKGRASGLFHTRR